MMKVLGDNGVSAIINNLSESVKLDPTKDKSKDDSQVNEAVCAVCGTEFQPTVDVGEGVICPNCGALVPQDKVLKDTDVVDPVVINGLEQAATDYADAVRNENFALARKIVSEAEATAKTCKDKDGNTGIVLEKMVKAIHNGKVVKVKVRTKKKHLTGAQKSALRKARKKSHTAGAARARRKSMKIRTKKGLGEGIDMSSTLAKNISMMTESLGHAPSTSAIDLLTKKIAHIQDVLQADKSGTIEEAITQELSDAGFKITDIETSRKGDGYIVVVTVDDSVDNADLDSIADEIESDLDGFDVAYSDPTPVMNEEDDEDDDDEDEETTYSQIVYTVVPSMEDTTDEGQMVESCKAKKPEKADESATTEDPVAKPKEEEAPATAVDTNVALLDKIQELIDATKSANQSDSCKKDESCKKSKKNESISINIGNDDDKSVDSLVGGRDNVLCQIDPQFIKVGQIIYDADDKAVFTALSTPVSSDEGFNITVEMVNAQDQDLLMLPRGSKVSITADTDYFLLRKSPVE